MRREYDFSKARRGPVVPAATGKTRITIRIEEMPADRVRPGASRPQRESSTKRPPTSSPPRSRRKK